MQFTWPAPLVPSETVVGSGTTVRWRPCLLVDASPHDGPAAIGGLSVPVLAAIDGEVSAGSGIRRE